MNSWRSRRTIAIRIDAMEQSPLYIRVHPNDNVAIVANDGGLRRRHRVRRRPGAARARAAGPQGRAGGSRRGRRVHPLQRGDRLCARRTCPTGSWVHERLLIRMPERAGLDGLPIATVKAPELPPLEGYTFEGYRNADGSVGTRNILAITTTVQCVAGVVEHRGHAHQGRAAAALSERRRRRAPRAHATAAASRSTRPTR